ncbi:MAG: T9SS type A sorting domain-containing protein [Bacteroidetes bacterium]|nr:T9SS type A sorting domain-containing protein [Bacteroidota bacterium]
MKKILIFISLNCLLFSLINAQTYTGYTKANSNIPNNNVVFVTIDHYGNKWLAVDSAISKFDGVNWTTWSLITSVYLSKSIYCIAIDNQDNKWIGTGDGLVKFDNVNFTRYTKSNSGVRNNTVKSVAVDSSGNIWAATLGGLSKFDGTTWTIIDTIGKYENCALAVEPYGAHAVWAAPRDRSTNTNYGHVFKYSNNQFLEYQFYYAFDESGRITSINFDKKHQIWLGTTSSGLYKFDGINWTHYWDSLYRNNQTNFVNSLTIDKYNNKWCGLNGGNIINTTLIKNNEDTTIFYSGFCPWSWVNSVATDSMDNKWIGVLGEGLWKLDCEPPAIPIAIHGPDTVYKGQSGVVYKLISIHDAYYNWTLPNGFTGSVTGDTIVVHIDTNAVSGVISVNGHNSCGIGQPITFNITVMASQTGNKEESNLAANLSVYPNPVSNNLCIENNYKCNMQINLYSITGKLLYYNKYENYTTFIDMSSYEKGIYYIEIILANGRKTVKKIVIN